MSHLVSVHPYPGTLSQAMHRVGRALEAHAPCGVAVVRARECGLYTAHVVGGGQVAMSYKPDLASYSVIQYCHASAGGGAEQQLHALWSGARMVWSYLRSVGDALPPGVQFYHAPLGVDEVFKVYQRPDVVRDIDVLTSGYVSGPGAEAIEEVWEAVHRMGGKAVHLGPPTVEGWERPSYIDWVNVQGITDEELAALYRRAKWVSGLRHIEGFELPAAEGLLCGARPIVFDRADMQWYAGSAAFVFESQGEALVEQVHDVLAGDWQPVLRQEWEKACSRFDWSTVATGWWEALL